MTLLRTYIVLAVLRGVATVMAVLLAVTCVIEFVGQLNDVGTGDYGLQTALIYVGLRVPGRIFTMLPIGALIGALLSLGNLAVHRELVVGARLTDEDMVEAFVSDTGHGISPDIAEQLFQPFMTTKQQGMGVGLSISRTIVEAHGGRIWVEPNPGGGTIFRFTLPAVQQTELSTHE